MDIPPCVEIAPDYGDIEVPPEMRRAGVVRIIAWTCLDPACPRDDDGPLDRPAMHYVMFTEDSSQNEVAREQMVRAHHQFSGPPTTRSGRQPRRQSRRDRRRSR